MYDPISPIAPNIGSRAIDAFELRGQELDTYKQACDTLDTLDMAYINSLPQPFIGRGLDGWEWPINDFEVSTGMLRIDVCGLLQVKTISDFTSFRDVNGVRHPAGGFYADAIPEERQPIA